MPERISYAVLAAAPITHDEYAIALKQVVEDRVMRNRRTEADARQDAALATLAEEEAKANPPEIEIVPPDEPIIGVIDTPKPMPTAKAKAKKEK